MKYAQGGHALVHHNNKTTKHSQDHTTILEFRTDSFLLLSLAIDLLGGEGGQTISVNIHTASTNNFCFKQCWNYICKSTKSRANNISKSTHGAREQTHYDWLFFIILIIIIIFRVLKSICLSYILFLFFSKRWLDLFVRVESISVV